MKVAKEIGPLSRMRSAIRLARDEGLDTGKLAVLLAKFHCLRGD